MIDWTYCGKYKHILTIMYLFLAKYVLNGSVCQSKMKNFAWIKYSLK